MLHIMDEVQIITCNKEIIDIEHHNDNGFSLVEKIGIGVN